MTASLETAITIYHEQGYSAAEIAKLVGVTESYVVKVLERYHYI